MWSVEICIHMYTEAIDLLHPNLPFVSALVHVHHDHPPSDIIHEARERASVPPQFHRLLSQACVPGCA